MLSVCVIYLLIITAVPAWAIPSEWFVKYVWYTGILIFVEPIQCVSETKTTSSWCSLINCSISSLFGGRPLIFQIATLNEAAITAGLSVLFADDTTVMVSARTYEQLGQRIDEGCEQLQRWFSSNGLLLNITKSNIMVFSGRGLTVPPCVASNPMPICNESRFLGFTLDSNLNWKCHDDRLCDRLSGAVFALRKLKLVISDSALRQVYFAYFHSLMSYGSLIWGNSTDA
ncbi:uncharacterized protein LOC113237398 [Hyposmocoma kahamanoa]|uniref:uncharacterized protein LOC113237398 n=1 Tax=Hyposmocoma kahamanoa TaxID=1477025 RepID=UPI000E6D92D7|nr:uncharacterized protein LOC113237398 [Hyposmocoma kahamanoa]